MRVVHAYSMLIATSPSSCVTDNETAPRSKPLGASIMESDFIDEVAGYVRVGEEQGHLLIEPHSDGYITNDRLQEQVAKKMDIFERVYPHATGIFVFDNAPSHCKIADDTLNAADKMNV